MKSYIDLLDKAEEAPPEYSVYNCARFDGPGIPAGLGMMRFRTYGDCAAPREGAVAALWLGGDILNVLAVMEDSDIKNSAVPKNDKTWSTGDVMEFFFQPSGGPDYVELHLAPTGATLELSFPSLEAFRTRKWGESFFESGMKTKVEKFVSPSGKKGWAGLVSVPLKSIGADGDRLNGARAAVCRYNYNSQWGEKPELSSTVSFKSGSFHNPPAWHVIKFTIRAFDRRA